MNTTKAKNMIDKLIEWVDEQVEKIDEKIEKINERADNRDSGELTEKEEEKIEQLESQKYILEDDFKEYLYQAQDSLDELED